jgi:thiol-disulfide isomerase/thioredoxin
MTSVRPMVLAIAASLSLGAAHAAHAQAATSTDEKTAAQELDQGQLLLAHREYFNAVTKLTHANQLRGGTCAACLIGLAEAMLGMRSYQNVLDSAAKVFAIPDIDPRWAFAARRLRAQAFSELASGDPQKYRDAETELREALTLNPRAEDLRLMLGRVLLKQNRDGEAVAELERVADARPDALGDEARRLVANPRRGREAYAPDFSITTVNAGVVSLESLKGKVVLVDFWATWCPPCIAALPTVRKLQKTHAADPFVILSISGDEDESVWRRFVLKNGMVWPQYFDHNGFRNQFNVTALPTYILLDGEGFERLRVVGSGLHDARALNDAIEKLLADTRRIQ